MKRTTWCLALAIGALSILSIPAYGGETAAQPAKSMTSAGAAHLVAADELKWNDVEGVAGVKMAVLQGDPGKGPAHFFLKLPGGFMADMHFHNADHYVAVVAGTLSLTPEGGAEKRLQAGSGFSFTGKKRHVTKCAAGSDCVLFLDARGPWDVIPVEKK